MRLYLAGPMTDHPMFNYPAFVAEAGVLRQLGHEVVSPVEIDGARWLELAQSSPDGDGRLIEERLGITWADFLARDVKLVAESRLDGIVVLDGWQHSRGARLETFVGRALCNVLVFRRVDDRLVTVSGFELVRAWAGDVVAWATVRRAA